VKIDIARALRDPEYRETVWEFAKALIPASSAGTIELDDEDLEAFAAGRKTRQTYSCTQTSGSGTCNCTCNAARIVRPPIQPPGAAA